MTDLSALIYRNLGSVLNEMERQTEIAATYEPGFLSFTDTMIQIREFLDVGEEGLAYEYIVACLEQYDFRLSGKAAVRLLEVGLLFGFKTERDADAMFNRKGE